MLLEKLGLKHPIIQAPMAGVSTPALAAAVCNAGGLGSIAVGATDAQNAKSMIDELRARTERAFNVNVFVHRAPRPDPAREALWLAWLRPRFAEFGAEPPTELRTIYTSFADDPAMLRVLLEARPAVVSFHFGLPAADVIASLKSAGVMLFATATSPEEATLCERAGIDVIVAQGIEAGGHRGVFDVSAPDDALGTLALTRLLAKSARVPVVAAGGIMDGAAIAASIALGAVAAQLGTAFIACPESSADAAYRAALAGPGAHQTRMTSVLSGRPARALANRFTALEASLGGLHPPDYPIAYDAAKQLHAVARAQGTHGFGAQWAGQGAPLSRALPAAALMDVLIDELRVAQRVAR